MSLGSVTPDFGLDRFGNPGATSRSGHERNRLFMSQFPGERQFADVSGVSGADSPADGRSVAFLDFDKDGFQDMALVNANAPKLELFRNQLGSANLVDPEKARMIAVRLVGGNQLSSAQSEWSSRDAYGAQIRVTADGQPLLRSLRAGEGLAAQHSRTLIVGIGAAGAASALEVRWPSGKRQSFGEIPAGTLVTVYEDPAQAPGGEALVMQPYFADTAPEPRRQDMRQRLARLDLTSQAADPSPAKLRLYVTTATWCEACILELPELELLRSRFSAAELQIFGVPTDPADTPEMLGEYLETHKPAYELLSDLSREDVARVEAQVLKEMGKEGIPASVLTDDQGRILATHFGAPTVSELRKFLSR